MIEKETDFSEDKVNWGKVGLVMMFWGLVSFVFAGYFAITQKSDKFTIDMIDMKSAQTLQGNARQQPVNQIGPIIVDRPGETWQVFVRAGVPENRWNFIEIEVLNEKEEYLYSFAQELWHETGHDSDGFWREKRNNFETNITFPEPGFYYLNFWSQKRYTSRRDKMDVRLTKRNGSSVLHNWAGIILILIGLVMVEIQWGVFRKTLEAMNEQD